MKEENINKLINECFNFPQSEKNQNVIMTGFNELDNITGGFKQGDLIIIGSRPSMGKTALALNIAQNVALQGKKAVALFSLEMPKQQLVKRMLCAEAEVDTQRITLGNVQPKDWEKLVDAMTRLSDAKIYIDDKPSVNVSHIKEKIMQFYLNNKEIKLIIIDYLQLMDKEEIVSDRTGQLEIILRSLKNLAREFNIPIIALSQLSRGVESRNDKRPMLSDLRDSGAIENYANIIMFLYREDYYNPENAEKQGAAEIIVAKNSNGKTGSATLLFDKKINKFS